MSNKRSNAQQEQLIDWRVRFVYEAPGHPDLEVKGPYVNLAVAVQTWLNPQPGLTVKRVEFVK